MSDNDNPSPAVEFDGRVAGEGGIERWTRLGSVEALASGRQVDVDQMSLEIIKLIFWVLIRIGLIILCSQRKEPWYRMPLLPVCRQSWSLLGP